MTETETETEIKKDIYEFLFNLEGFLVVETPNQGRLLKGKRLPVKEKGVPDLTGCCVGKYIAIEVKKPGGKQSEFQKLFEQKVIRCGGLYWLVESVDDVIKKLIKDFNMVFLLGYCYEM